MFPQPNYRRPLWPPIFLSAKLPKRGAAANLPEDKFRLHGLRPARVPRTEKRAHPLPGPRQSRSAAHAPAAFRLGATIQPGPAPRPRRPILHPVPGVPEFFSLALHESPLLASTPASTPPVPATLDFLARGPPPAKHRPKPAARYRLSWPFSLMPQRKFALDAACRAATAIGKWCAV